MPQPLFHHEGDIYRPTPSAGGPWSPDFLHGGPPVGLLAWALEREVAGSGLCLARLPTDLLRPVPAKPLAVRVQTLRAGRRLRVLEGVLEADGVLVTRATALFLEQVPLQVPAHGRFPADTLPSGGGAGGSLSDVSMRQQKRTAFTSQGLHTTVETHLIDGVEGRGEGRVWMRLPVSVVDDEPDSRTVQAATLADFGNGVAQLQLAEDMGCINGDVTLYLTREPRSEWIGLDARAHMSAGGNGLVETRLYDEQGIFGQVSQSILAMPFYTAE